MAKPKILVFAPEKAGEIASYEQRLIDLGCDLSQGAASWRNPQGNSESEIVQMARGADAMMGTSIRSARITRKIMESAENLRIISKFTIGYDDVDVDAATDLGVIVTHGPTEANWGGVAEGTIGIMLTLLKKIRERDEIVKAGGWRTDDQLGTYIGARLQDGYQGLTIGIVGLGRIGRRLAELLRPWRVRLLCYDPYCEMARFTLSGVIRTDLETLLKKSDVVSLHCNLNETSRKLINAKTLALMKKSAILINCSRGGVVDTAALVAALEKDAIAGAGLDVFEQEPLPADSPLRKLGHKVLLSAHVVTGNRNDGVKPGALWAAQAVELALRGEVPDNVVNPEVLPRWQQRFIRKSLIE
jgi:phosphoglycerate dehydrogenase-like enzyme